MIRVTLRFDTSEEHNKAMEAVNWLVEREGIATNIQCLQIHYLPGWRVMPGPMRDRILWYLDRAGGWWLADDLYVGVESNQSNYQHFFFKDANLAMMFKLKFA